MDMDIVYNHVMIMGYNHDMIMGYNHDMIMGGGYIAPLQPPTRCPMGSLRAAAAAKRRHHLH